LNPYGGSSFSGTTESRRPEPVYPRDRSEVVEPRRGHARASIALIGLLLAIAPHPLTAQLVDATLVLAEGDIPTGGDEQPVVELNSPFTNGHGQVGFVGEFETEFGTEDSFIWIGDAVVWKNSDAPQILLAGGSEQTMGISDRGGFIYSTRAEGDDVLVTQFGLLAREGDPAPGYDEPAVVRLFTEPTMTRSGRAYWIAGIDLEAAGTTDGQALYTSPDGSPDTIQTVLRFGDTVDGQIIQDGTGLGFDYSLSDNGHHIHSLSLETGDPFTDDALYVDGAIVAQEGFPTGDGDNWDSFDLVSINESGDYLFSGDTDSPSEFSEFIGFNASIVLREGDTIDGVPLTGGARVRGLSLNELGHSIFLWDHEDSETLFFACDAQDPRSTAVALLSEGDELDFDGDGVANATVTDFNASDILGPGLSLSERGVAHVEVDLDDGDNFEGIIELVLPSCGDEPTLSFSGECPGRVTLTAGSASPGGPLALIGAPDAGSTPVPGGPCQGLDTGLGDIGLLALLPADSGGGFVATGTIDASRCGLLARFVDVKTCRLSSLDAVPGVPPQVDTPD